MSWVPVDFRVSTSISRIDHNLEYGDIKYGQLEDWLVKKIFLICIQSKKFKKELMLKFKMISRTGLVFMIAFMVYE